MENVYIHIINKIATFIILHYSYLILDIIDFGTYNINKITHECMYLNGMTSYHLSIVKKEKVEKGHMIHIREEKKTNLIRKKERKMGREKIREVIILYSRCLLSTSMEWEEERKGKKKKREDKEKEREKIVR